MARVYPTNQNRHFYVVKKCINGKTKTVTIDGVETTVPVEVTDTVGNIEVKTIGQGKDKELYFVYNGPGGKVIKSDYIQVKNLDYVKAKDAWSMLRPLKKVQIQVPGNTIVNDDYVLRIVFRGFHAIGDDSTYIKDAVVRGHEGMNITDFFKKMKEALDRSFSREVGATKNSNPYLEFSAGTNDLIIREKIQDYNREVGGCERVYFEVYPTTIYHMETQEDFVWGTVSDQTKDLYKSDGTPNVYDSSTNTDGISIPLNAAINGPEIADLEWFCLGERGDQYRKVGWPDYIPTHYQVDPEKQYHVLEIHHAFTDTGVNSYRGEKDITIVAEQVDGTDTGKAVINDIIEAIKTATGLTSTDIPSLT